MQIIPPADLPFPLLHVNTTEVGTTAITTEEILMTYSLPANTLLRDGQGIRIRAQFSLAANANNKTQRLYFGSTVIAVGPGPTNAKDVIIDFKVFRTGIGTQDIFRKSHVSGAASTRTSFSATEDETAAIVIKITGQNGTAAVDDTVGELLTVELINAN